MTAEEFAHKIWYTESAGRLYDWGDGGLAIGMYQVHAAWVFDWARRLELEPLVDESWNAFTGRLVRGFYQWHQGTGHDLTPVQIAMHFHLGHISLEIDDDWDETYAVRFDAAPTGAI